MSRSPDAIMIGICTFRRPMVAETLASLARIALPDHPVSVIVADNDDRPTASAVVTEAALGHPLPVRFIHAPSRNISIARNAILDAARADGVRYLAYVDDDETVSPGWLTSLLARMAESGAQAVVGPVRGRYGTDSPAWMREGSVHDTWPEVDALGAVREAFSGNVILDLSARALEGLRFDSSRGRTGGEDTAFFHGLKARGGWIAFSPEAAVDEVVPPERASLRWLLRRRYRMGQTHASLLVEGRGGLARGAAIAVAAAKVMACLGLAGLSILSPLRRNLALMRGALHLGVLAELMGLHRVEIYSEAPPGPSRREPLETGK